MIRRRAFTLIELLVVIAIIAILAAILFPVFAKAREKARQSSCQSNLKQLAIGIMQYVQDYDETYPGRNSYDEPHSWRVNVQPYLKSAQVFSCPSNLHGSYMSSDGTMPVSYGCNGHDAFNTPMHWGTGVKLAAVISPASLILVCESNNGWSEMNLDGAYDWGGWWNPPWLPSMFAGHMGNSNFAFADGHVKAMKPSATVNATAPLNMWACDGPNVAPFNVSVTQLTNVTNFYANQ